MSQYNVMQPETGGLVKMWTNGVQVEDGARQQLANVASMPFIHKWVAAMPDVHWGMGATIGSVIPTHKAIIPAAVGVDIGCGMMAVRTDLVASDLPDNLAGIRTAIEASVPHGRSNNGGRNDRGGWGNVPDAQAAVWNAQLSAKYEALCSKHPKMRARNNVNHLGTLGTGNHFIEVGEVEPGGGGAARPEPQRGRRELVRQVIHFVTRLDERVGEGLQEVRDAIDGASEPRFQVGHYPTRSNDWTTGSALSRSPAAANAAWMWSDAR